MRLLRNCAESGRSRTRASDDPRDREGTNPVLQSIRRRLIAPKHGSIRVFHAAARERVSLLNDRFDRNVIRSNFVGWWNIEDHER